MTVVFHPVAEEDLGQIFDFIAIDSPKRAIGFVRGIRTACLGIAEFSERGRFRRDHAENVRTMVLERRVVIAYKLDGKDVVILRIFYAGQQMDRGQFEG